MQTISLMEYVGVGSRVIMGPGSVANVVDEIRLLGGSRIMLLTGGKTAKTKLAARVIELLGSLLADNFDLIVEHSGTDIVELAAKRAIDARVDLLLALGGGSASDTAKAVAILLAEGAPLHSHANRFTPPDKLIQQQLNRPKLPILAIPTTASAAEVTPGLGIRAADGHKLLFWDVKVAARTIILDPEANTEVPAKLMATSGMNAVAHCIEGLYSKKRNPIADGLALQGLRLLGQGLPAMMRAPADIDARAQVLYGAHLSGMVIASTRTCLHHGLCHVLGALGGLSHGVANSIMLPHVMKFNARSAASQLRLVAQALGVEVSGLSDEQAADKGVDAIVELQQSIGVPTRLRDSGLQRKLMSSISENVMGDRALFFNPGPAVTPQDVLQILEAAW
ncbi:MAG: iron-containing alcohol dehydrogenase [Alcaligenaceae bacterium]